MPYQRYTKYTVHVNNEGVVLIANCNCMETFTTVLRQKFTVLVELRMGNNSI